MKPSKNREGWLLIGTYPDMRKNPVEVWVQGDSMCLLSAGDKAAGHTWTAKYEKFAAEKYGGISPAWDRIRALVEEHDRGSWTKLVRRIRKYRRGLKDV